jgi:LuxR family maltose regulon positive regulatory protein
MNAQSPPGLPQAIDKLNSWRQYRLALLVAPPGSGKTALLRQWSLLLEDREMAEPTEGRPTRVAWIDLGPQDNLPDRFLEDLDAALHAAGLPALPLQNSPVPEAFSRFEIGMTVLANALAQLRSHLILVLDQNDHIQAPEIHAAVSLLLDYPPPMLHLVIACRAEPPLPIPRLRARRQLIDVSPADLPPEKRDEQPA